MLLTNNDKIDMYFFYKSYKGIKLFQLIRNKVSRVKVPIFGLILLKAVGAFVHIREGNFAWWKKKKRWCLFVHTLSHVHYQSQTLYNPHMQLWAEKTYIILIKRIFDGLNLITKTVGVKKGCLHVYFYYPLLKDVLNFVTFFNEISSPDDVELQSVCSSKIRSSRFNWIIVLLLLF